MGLGLLGKVTGFALGLLRRPFAQAQNDLRKSFTLIFLQKVTGVFDDGMRLPARAGYQFLKDGCRRGSDGVFVAKGGEKGLLKFKQGFPGLPICGCCGVLGENGHEQRKLSRPRLITFIGASIANGLAT